MVPVTLYILTDSQETPLGGTDHWISYIVSMRTRVVGAQSVQTWTLQELEGIGDVRPLEGGLMPDMVPGHGPQEKL